MNHPYPQKIVDEVADYLKPYTASRIEAGSLAHQVLRRVWKASQVDTLPQVDQLPDDAILWGSDDMEHDKFTLHTADINNELHQALPAHVIYWGDTDE